MGDLLLRLLAAIIRVFQRFFNLKIKLKYVLLAIVVLVGSAVGIVYSKMMRAVGGKEDYNEAQRYIEMKDVLDNNFIDPVDRNKLTASASNAMVTSLGDKWSYFMSPDEYKTYQLYSASEYSDIGMSIIKDEASGGFAIKSVNAGSPAGLAGLSAGQIIVSVDGESVLGSDIDAVRTMIRSRMNTKFNVGVLNEKEELTVNCAATYVSAVKSRLEKTEAGYVQIGNFEAGSGQDAVDAIEELMHSGATSLVIDVRNNPGGLPGEITILLNHLLPQCDLFSIVGKDGKAETFRSDTTCLNTPTVVLINGGTYAEAEVFAAVMQEYGWATLLGESTEGKTRTQETLELSDGSAVRLSTHRYITPKGTDLSLNGVVPDSIVHNSDESATGTTEGTTGVSNGTGSTSLDEQLMAALRMLS